MNPAVKLYLIMAVWTAVWCWAGLFVLLKTGSLVGFVLTVAVGAVPMGIFAVRMTLKNSAKAASTDQDLVR